jgi:hypothetical protein
MQINYVRYRTFILLLRSFAVLPYFASVTKPTQNTAAKKSAAVIAIAYIFLFVSPTNVEGDKRLYRA